MTSNRFKIATRGLVFLLILTGTLAGGLIRRQLGAGGENDVLLKHAAKALLRPLPEQIGNWQLFDESDLEPEVVKMLRCPGYINQVYVHEQTGDRVSVAVLLGPAGPIAVHTPEICYSGRDFTLASERKLAKLPGSQTGEHAFWEVHFRTNDVAESQLRVLYAWTTGNRWEAAQDPRFTYAASSYLYKIQIAGSPANDATGFDACQDFLAQFIPHLQAQLVAADPA